MATRRITESDSDDNDTRLRLRTKHNKKRSMYRHANTPIQNISRSDWMRDYYRNNPSARTRLSKSMQKHWDDPKWRKKVTDIFRSSEFRTAQSLKMKAVYKRKKALK